MADQDLVLAPEDDSDAGLQLNAQDKLDDATAGFDQFPSVNGKNASKGHNSDSLASPEPVSKKQRGEVRLPAQAHLSAESIASFQREQHSGPQPHHVQYSNNRQDSEMRSDHHTQRPQLSPSVLHGGPGFEFDISNHRSAPRQDQLDGAAQERADRQEHDLSEDQEEVQDLNGSFQPLTDTVRDGLHLISQEKDSILQQMDTITQEGLAFLDQVKAALQQRMDNLKQQVLASIQESETALRATSLSTMATRSMLSQAQDLVSQLGQHTHGGGGL